MTKDPHQWIFDSVQLVMCAIGIRGDFMSKKLLTIITGIIIVCTLTGAIIWAISEADENGKIYLEGNENIAYIFLGLSILGLITGSISLRASNEEGDIISKKSVLSGVALATIFFHMETFGCIIEGSNSKMSKKVDLIDISEMKQLQNV